MGSLDFVAPGVRLPNTLMQWLWFSLMQGVAKRKEPHEENEPIRILELVFEKHMAETFRAHQGLALLYVTRPHIKGPYHPRTLDSFTFLATILMFYSFLADSSRESQHLASLDVEPGR